MSSDLNPEFVERCQILLSQDPKSRIFAPLAEAYRKMNLLEEAEAVAKKGVEIHPDFPSGLVVYAKILLDRKKLDLAAQQLKKASELSPENILAHRLLSQTYLELKKPKEAMRALKMVLFLNPNDPQAAKTVARLESLTADEYDDELFEMKPLQRAVEMMSPVIDISVESPISSTNVHKIQRTLDRALSLADAFFSRNDFDKALETLERAEEEIGTHPEIAKRKRLMTSRQNPSQLKVEEPTPLSPSVISPRQDAEQKVLRLKSMLQRVNDRRVE